MNQILNEESYLQSYFHADERVRTAAAELSTAQEKLDKGTATDDDGTEVAPLSAWNDRVQQWRQNTRAALRADSIAAPGRPDARWLLYASPPSAVRRGSETDTVSCSLCRKCARDLSGRKGKTTPAPKMPLKARARGLWQGQEPESLRVLTYAERRVLRLGRVYATIKRVMVKDALWSGGNVAALP